MSVLMDSILNYSGQPIKRVTISKDRDALLSDFGTAILSDRYLMYGESYQDLFARVATYYADDDAHAQRLYDRMSQLHFMPATPVLANGGTNRGLPISCFLNECQDSMDSIAELWRENVALASNGGGIGSYFGNIRSINEAIKNKGTSSGVIPFLKVMDSMTLAVSQGSLRRGSAAVYMRVDHPEIDEFVDIRRQTGDHNRRCHNLHHGVVITDAFMAAVMDGSEWALKSPASGAILSKISARELWIKLLNTRIETGEPYLLFIDNVNKAIPDHQKKLGLTVKTSNLCSEITLPTGIDHLGKERTAVCCLSSLNLEFFEEWSSDAGFVMDVMRFLDNVLQDFINKAPNEMAHAKYSAERERSVGLGVMGLHSFLQKNMIPLEGVAAKSWNKKIFSFIKAAVDRASHELALEKGACLDAVEVGAMERFSNKIAIAPTASISVIANNASPGIEPYAANVWTQKTMSGSFTIRNVHLRKLLRQKGKDLPDVWSSISINAGSVQQLDFLTQEEKDIFKTSLEINQRWLVEHAADRLAFVCQAQSLNLFFQADVSKKELHDVHYNAWKLGNKSLYYCRSRSLQRADQVSDNKGILERNGFNASSFEQAQLKTSAGAIFISTDDECLACQ